MARRAHLSEENTQRALGEDFLDRILPEEEAVEVVEIPIDQIDPNPFQPRRFFDEAGLRELATSIQAQGFFGHLVARRAGQRYQLAYGERRLKAAKMAGLEKVPLALRELTDGQMLEIAIAENVQRKDLNPIEEAMAYHRLVEMGYSYRQIAQKVGKSAGHISDLLKLLRYPEIAKHVQEGTLGIVEGRELASIEDDERRKTMLEHVLKGAWDRDRIKQQARKARGAELPNPIPLLRTARKKLEAIQLELYHFSEEEIKLIRQEVELLYEHIQRIIESLDPA